MAWQAARGLAPIAAVLEQLRTGAWDAALEPFVLARGLALVAQEDPALAGLLAELLTLEAQIVALSSDQAELERQIRSSPISAACSDWRSHGGMSALCTSGYWRLRAERSQAQADLGTAQAEAEADQAEFQRDREAFEQKTQAERG